jgi:hypothetical protein
MHACIHTYLSTYIHTHIHTYIPKHIHTYLSTYTHTCIHVHTCMHACIHTHIRTYRYTCTHAHTHDFDAIRCTLLHARICVVRSCLPARVTCVHMGVIGTMCGHACMHCKYGHRRVCLESPRMRYVYYARLGIHNGCGLALHVRVNKVSSRDMCVCVCVFVCA